MENIIQVIYDLLALIEFTSSRKRMSVLVKTKEGKILLLSKGADSVIMARLADDQKGATIKAQDMIDEVSPGRVTINYHIGIFQFAREGLRTMALGMREVSNQMTQKMLKTEEYRNAVLGLSRGI